jgi:GxxExxY protein
VYGIDFLVDDAVVLELNSVARFDPVFAAQIRTYLRRTGKRLGLGINFGRETLVAGISRFAL